MRPLYTEARAGEVRLSRAPGVRCLQSLAAVSGQAVNDTASPEVCRDAAWSAHPVRRLQRVVEMAPRGGFRMLSHTSVAAG